MELIAHSFHAAMSVGKKEKSEGRRDSLWAALVCSLLLTPLHFLLKIMNGTPEDPSQKGFQFPGEWSQLTGEANDIEASVLSVGADGDFSLPSFGASLQQSLAQTMRGEPRRPRRITR